MGIYQEKFILQYIMDIKKYTELSRELIDHYVSIDDYKMALLY